MNRLKIYYQGLFLVADSQRCVEMGLAVRLYLENRSLEAAFNK